MGSLARTVSPRIVSLTATPSVGQVALSWPAAADTFGAVVQTLTRTPPFAGAVNPTANSYIDTSVTGGLDYTYSLVVIDGRGLVSFTPAVMATVPNPAGSVLIKWHPGHYILTPTVGAVVQDDLNAVSLANIRGMQHRIYWATLEPTKDNYNFASITAALNALPAGKRLILQVMERESGTASQTGIVPNYILNDPEYNGGVAANNNGWRAKVYVLAVEERLTRLYEAVAAAFNTHPKFEALTLIESSSFNPIPSDVSSAAELRILLAAAIKRIVTRCVVAFENCTVCQYTNSLVGQLSGIIRHCQLGRAGVGGPDVLPPPHSDVSGSRIIRGAETDSASIPITDYRPLCPVMFAIQGPELGGKESDEALGPGNNWTPAQLVDHAILTNGAHYLCTLRSEAAVVEVRWTSHWLPYFTGSPRPTVQPPPSNYNGNVETT